MASRASPSPEVVLRGLLSPAGQPRRSPQGRHSISPAGSGTGGGNGRGPGGTPSPPGRRSILGGGRLLAPAPDSPSAVWKEPVVSPASLLRQGLPSILPRRGESQARSPGHRSHSSADGGAAAEAELLPCIRKKARSRSCSAVVRGNM